MGDTQELQSSKEIKTKQQMKEETIEAFKDSVPILWDTKGKYLHSCELRYRKAKLSEINNVCNWATRDEFKKDAERFAMSKYATKAQKSKFITE